MSDYYYIDTSSLKWRYMTGKPTAEVDRIMNDATNVVLTAELTLLEWSSALAAAYRDGAVDNPDTFKRNEVALMNDILAERIKVLPPIVRAVEKARYLIEYIGVEKKLSLKTGDALHLIYAIEAASHFAESVTVITSDSKLANILQSVNLNLGLLYLSRN
jgi:hypothetical protein